jgi:hypothetical protein
MPEPQESKIPADALPDLRKTNPEQWQAFCMELLGQIERLRSEIDSLREQRRRLLDYFLPGRRKHCDIDDDEILQHSGAEPTVEQLIQEFEQSMGK